MNCDCKKNIEETILKNPWKGKKILSAELQGMLVFGNTAGFYSSSTITMRLEGQKKQEEVEIKHTYCPFCGKKEDISTTKKS